MNKAHLGMIAAKTGGLEPETIAYLEAGSLYLTTDYALIVNEYVKACKKAGVFETDDEHYILAQSTAIGARVNLINPAQSLTTTNNPTFTQYTGYTGGSNSYLSSPTNVPALDRYSADDCNIGFVLVGDSASSFSYDLGAGGSQIMLGSKESSNYLFFTRLNNIDNTPEHDEGFIPFTNFEGYYIATFQAAGEYQKCYQDGIRYKDKAGTPGTKTIPDSPMTLLGIPGASVYSTRTIGLYHAGSAVSDAQATARNAAWQAYKTAINELT